MQQHLVLHCHNNGSIIKANQAWTAFCNLHHVNEAYFPWHFSSNNYSSFNEVPHGHEQLGITLTLHLPHTELKCSITEVHEDLFVVLATVASDKDKNCYIPRNWESEALHNSEERLAYIIEATNVGTWEWNVPTGEVVFNERWATMLGYTLEELSPATLNTWQRLAHPQDLTLCMTLIEKHMAGELEYYDCECRLQHKNGHWIWVQDRGKVISRNEQGEPIIMAGAHTDITSRKQYEMALYKEQQFRDILLNTARNFINVNKNDLNALLNEVLASTGQFFDVDRSYIFLFDYKRNAADNTHEWCSEGITPEIENLQDVPFDAFEAWFRHMEKDENVYIPEVAALTGDWADVKAILEPQGIQSLIAVPISIRGKLLGFAGFDSVRKLRSWTENEMHLLRVLCSNIAGTLDRIEHETALISAKNEADAASKAKSEFLANMSHEIRTPLNGVIGFTELLMHTPLTETQRLFVENANNSAQTLMSLISDILDVSKIEAGKLELDVVQTDFVSLIEQSTDMLKLAASKKGIELMLDIDPNIPRTLHTDPVRLKQVLVNLLSNAVKFTHRGEVELSVKLVAIHPHNNTTQIRVAVRDTGVGISQDDQKKLFKMFSQADTSTTRKYGGTGLGLVISQMLLAKMGGELALRSEPGTGSEFSFTIQLTYPNTQQVETLLPDHYKNVLVVDDNERTRNIILNMLQHLNIQADGVANGFMALEKLSHPENDYDLMIIDFNMPYMTGLEVAAQVRNRLHLTADVLPIILLHNMADDALLLQECQALDVKAQLLKPVKLTVLFEAMARLKAAVSPYGKSTNADASQRVLQMNPTITDDDNAADKGPTVLIVEDNAVNMLLSTTIIQMNYPTATILKALNGKEAINLYNRFRPDIILMDLQMPEMDGYTATREIRKMPTDKANPVPIVALTAGALKGEMDKCIEAGMNDFMTKPINREALEDVVAKYLKNVS